VPLTALLDVAGDRTNAKHVVSKMASIRWTDRGFL